MRFVIATIGTEGDVRPYITLARALKSYDQEVVIATSDNYFPLINSFGIDCVPIKLKGPFRRPASPFNLRMIKTVKASIVNMEGYLTELWNACRDADAIIYNVATFPCIYIAEKLRIPSFGAFMQPHHPTKAFPDPSVTNGKPLGGIFNVAGFWLFDLLHWAYVRKSINRWRKETLHLPEIPLWDTVITQMTQRKSLILYAYSPSLVPKPPEWRSDRLQVTGYWYLDTYKGYQPVPELERFLESGPPPVFLSVMWNIEKLTWERIIKLSNLLDTRLIVHDLHGDLAQNPPTARIYYIRGPIPHEWLFKKISAAVHHGGLGISMNCIRAGVPIVAIPGDSAGNDHRFWAYQLSRADVGIFVDIPGKSRRFVPRLAAAITTVLKDGRIKTRATELSRKVCAETGLQNAVRLIMKEVGIHKERTHADMDDR
jgi:sterol 3beta-glucosyltransferase